MQLASVWPQPIEVPAAALVTLTTNRSPFPGEVTDAATKAHQRSPVAPSSHVQGGPCASSDAASPVNTSVPVAAAARPPPAPPMPPSPVLPPAPPRLPPVPPSGLPELEPHPNSKRLANKEPKTLKRASRTSIRAPFSKPIRGKGHWTSAPDGPQALVRASTVIIAAPHSGKISGMCELLGMECNVPTDIVFSFTGLRHARRQDRAARRRLGAGALRGPRRARLPRADARLRRARSRASSRDNPIKTLLAIGARAQADARHGVARQHPPVRARAVGPALGLRAQRHAARACASASSARFEPRSATPTASTPSAACSSALRAALPGGYPKRAARAVAGGGRAGRRAGRRRQFNFLLGDGRHLFARCATKLCYIVRKAPFGPRHARRRRVAVDFSDRDHPARPRRRRRHRRRSRATRSGPGRARDALGVRPGRAARDAAQRRAQGRAACAAAGGARADKAGGLGRPAQPRDLGGGRLAGEEERMLGCA